MTVENDFGGADADAILVREAGDRRRAAARAVAAALGALRRLSAEAHSADVERALVRAVSDFVLERLHAERVTTALATWDGCLEVAAVSARGPVGREDPQPDTYMRRAVAARKTIAASGGALPTVLVVPLVVRGRAVGGIGVERSGPRAFDEVEVLTAEIAADLLGGRIEALRLAAKV